MLSLLVSIGFQVLFHSPPGVLFTFPSRYYSAIGHWVVFSLGGWSPRIPTGFHVSRGTLDPAWSDSHFTYRAVTSYGAAFLPSSVMLSYRCGGPNPRAIAGRVWALPRSLAATQGIDVSFFSSGYLDVSVRRVPSACAMYLRIGDRLFACRVSTFGHPWVEACLRLTMAFRSLLRPSSAPSAKAFSLRSFSLDRLVNSLTRNCSPSLYSSSIIGFNANDFEVMLHFSCSPFLPLLYSLCSFQGTLFLRITWFVVGSSRLELPTSRLSGVRSNQLSYEPPFPRWWR